MENLKRFLVSLVLTVVCTLAYAQTMKVSGTVISADDNMGVIGATVKEKGTTNATVTDMDGNFTITVRQGAVLEFSYIGLQTIELPAQQDMKVTLSSDTKTIDEVVVTATRRRKRPT